MTVTLELSPEVETQVAAKAAQKGLAVPDYLRAVVEETVRPETPTDHTEKQAMKQQEALAFLHQRIAKDKTDDPEELEKRRVEWEEFKQALNESHTSDRVLFP